MRVKELIQELSKFKDNDEVIFTNEDGDTYYKAYIDAWDHDESGPIGPVLLHPGLQVYVIERKREAD